MEGWISLHRKIKEHWLWKSQNRFQWWIDILLTVNHSDNKVLIKGTLIECNRGQSVRSLESWAKDWNVTKKTVRDFFILLQNDNMIVSENIKISTRITVCNYDSYQVQVNAKETIGKRQVNAKETPSKRKQHPNNNVNNEENENNDSKNKFNFRKELLNLNIEIPILDDWLKVRKTKKATNTETAYNKIKKQIELSGLTANECIKRAVESDWKGFEADWLKKTNGQSLHKITPDIQSNPNRLKF